MVRRGVRGVTARRTTVLAAAALVLAAGCVEKVEAPTTQAQGQTPGSIDAAGMASTQGGQNADGPPVIEQLAGKSFSFEPPAAPVAAEGEPIRIGMINQENTPIGSFPELRLGAQAAADLINTELGGVDGRPIEIVPCISNFSVETSQRCAQDFAQDDSIVAVTGGIDLASTGSIPVLEQNELAYLGGIPVNFAEQRSPISFQWSGGSAGSMVAFAWHAATELDADKIVIAYGEYEPITAAAEIGRDVALALGVDEVEMVSFPVVATDFLPTLSKIKELDPDAVLVGAADTACAPFMKGAHDLGIEAQLYLVGACAAPQIATEVGPDAVEGAMFNVESPVDPSAADNSDGEMYFAAIAKYGDPQLSGASAATISFRDVMNIWMLMTELGADGIDRGSLIDLVRQAEGRPQFYGHDYTCDGQQIPDLPSICAPQQVIVKRSGDAMVPETEWIDVPQILADTQS
ncbi:MAG: ABC transporter substrate-binding protein [Acidimicrobiales bacterium]|nr:ABC transporter substrate-binding protein [Acidimicrobiales bacterium]